MRPNLKANLRISGLGVAERRHRVSSIGRISCEFSVEEESPQHRRSRRVDVIVLGGCLVLDGRANSIHREAELHRFIARSEGGTKGAHLGRGHNTVIAGKLHVAESERPASTNARLGVRGTDKANLNISEEGKGEKSIDSEKCREVGKRDADVLAGKKSLTCGTSSHTIGIHAGCLDELAKSIKLCLIWVGTSRSGGRTFIILTEFRHMLPRLGINRHLVLLYLLADRGCELVIDCLVQVVGGFNFHSANFHIKLAEQGGRKVVNSSPASDSHRGVEASRRRDNKLPCGS